MITSIFTNPVTMVGLLVWAIVVAAGTYVALGRITPSTADDDERDDIVKRVLRNSAIPIASQLFIRVADLAVAIVLLRLLGPEGNGRYALAVVVWLYVKTISDFGLTLLATRDIARDRAIAGGLVGATTLLRILILAIAAIPVGIYVGIGMTTDTV
jgi:O-antigen/teichoic acid export membrane protein